MLRLRHLGTMVVAASAMLLLVTVSSRLAAFARLFGKHAGVGLTQTEIALAHNLTQPDVRREVVPRIIHQIYHDWRDPGNETLPADWEETRQTCVQLHPDWKYELWTEQRSRRFIETEYSWFLGTYDGFKYPVQRVDALRYLLLRHYGGIYIDLDNGCLTSLEALLYYPVWVTDGGHGALSNNILGAAPQHPFYILVTESMQRYAWNYPLPYVTISYATGQWFETDMWQQYHAQKPADSQPLTRVMMDMRPGSSPWVFFTHTRGGSWDNWDNHVFAWIGSHLLLAVMAIAAVMVVVSGMAVVGLHLLRRMCLRSRGYRLVGK
ncbi:hypothetical protein CDD82_133 [Ophiocordyceps australis]|uniref:Mannosyl phosphorylinositol ceramide synthase SUR1 n=1 Tax=Ophiocordyceps australis TaxID=1399860 RepID=A0A2C5YMR0_9HYPO|nr:hypothetical protein CDD82_133 [Ophiocordyceps australis]